MAASADTEALASLYELPAASDTITKATTRALPYCLGFVCTVYGIVSASLRLRHRFQNKRHNPKNNPRNHCSVCSINV